MKIKELIEKRDKLAGNIGELRDKFTEQGDKWEGEQRQQWDTVNAEFDQVTADIEQAETAAEVQARAEAAQEARDAVGNLPQRQRREIGLEGGRHHDAPEINEETRALAFRGWMRHQQGIGATDEQRNAAAAVGLRLDARDLEVQLPSSAASNELYGVARRSNARGIADTLRESRALSTFVGASGGLTVPVSYLQQLEINMLAFGGIRQVAELLVTEGGGDLPLPFVDDTGNDGETVTGDNQNISADEDPSFGALILKAYKHSSKIIKISQELLEDSMFDLAVYLGAAIGVRLGRRTAALYTTGTGASQPTGLITAATLGVTAASAAAIKYDELIDLEYSVDAAYRSMPGAGYMMSDTVTKAVRKLKDGEGRYLWQVGENGARDRLNGFPLFSNHEMSGSVAASEKVIAFGDFSKYKIRRVRTQRTYRLVERYREYDQEGFVGMLREDGGLLDAGTAPVKYLQMASS